MSSESGVYFKGLNLLSIWDEFSLPPTEAILINIWASVFIQWPMEAAQFKSY